MYRIEGDGSWQHTKIWKDGELINYEFCNLVIAKEMVRAWVDGVDENVSRVILKGIYKIISEGLFENTRIFIFDEMLRGVQSIDVMIAKDKHPQVNIRAILLPNLIEE
jgi:hypothetical protein